MSTTSYLLKKLFISRATSVAQQEVTGEYKPLRTDGRPPQDIPWSDALLTQHLNGERSLGHYLLDEEGNTKLFAFDIDLKKNEDGTKPNIPEFTGTFIGEDGVLYSCNPRVDWHNRLHPARPYLKQGLMWAAHTFAKTTSDMFGLPVAAAYSGNKGVHVYAFLGKKMSAEDAREAADLVMAEVGEFEAFRGKSFYEHKDQSYGNMLRNLTIEIFPKQTGLSSGGYGNLMRLPLGRNFKNPKDPTFFLDLGAPGFEMRPIEPMAALSGLTVQRNS